MRGFLGDDYLFSNWGMLMTTRFQRDEKIGEEDVLSSFYGYPFPHPFVLRPVCMSFFDVFTRAVMWNFILFFGFNKLGLRISSVPFLLLWRLMRFWRVPSG